MPVQTRNAARKAAGLPPLPSATTPKRGRTRIVMRRSGDEVACETLWAFPFFMFLGALTALAGSYAVINTVWSFAFAFAPAEVPVVYPEFITSWKASSGDMITESRLSAGSRHVIFVNLSESGHSMTLWCPPPVFGGRLCSTFRDTEGERTGCHCYPIATVINSAEDQLYMHLDVRQLTENKNWTMDVGMWDAHRQHFLSHQFKYIEQRQRQE